MFHKTYKKYNNCNSCVYLITYLGNKHPPYYIGSTYLDNFIENNYMGSVTNKQWALIVKKELLENPHLYTQTLLDTCFTREDAMTKERYLQSEMNVVNDNNFYNKIIAGETFGSIEGLSKYIKPNGKQTFCLPENASKDWIKGGLPTTKEYVWYKTKHGFKMCLPEDADDDWIKEGPAQTKNYKHYRKNNGDYTSCLPEDAEDDWVEEGSSKNTKHFLKPDGTRTNCKVENAEDDWVEEGFTKGYIQYLTTENIFVWCLPCNALPGYIEQGNMKGYKSYMKPDGTFKMCLPEEAHNDWVLMGATTNYISYIKSNGENTRCLPQDAEDDWVEGFNRSDDKCDYCGVFMDTSNLNQHHNERCPKWSLAKYDETSDIDKLVFQKPCW